MPTLIFAGCSSGLGLRVLHLVLSRLSALPSPLSPASPSSARWRLIAGTRRPTPSAEQVKLSLLASNSFPEDEEEVELLWLPLDLADGSGKSVREFVRLVREEHGVEEVQGVVLNAAVWGGGEGRGVVWEAPAAGSGEEEGKYVEEAVVNHFAQQHLVHLLLPLLKSAASSSSSSTAIPPRIIYTSSNLHESISSLDDLPSILSSSSSSATAPSKTRYAASKVASLIGAQSLLEDFAASSTGIDVVAVSPGFVPTTNLSRSSGWLGQLFMRYVVSWAPFAVTEEEGSQRILRALPLPSPSSSSSSSSAPIPTPDPLTSLLLATRSSPPPHPHPHLLYLSGPSTSPLEEVAKPVGGAVGRAVKQREEEGEQGGGGKWGEVKARWVLRGV